MREYELLLVLKPELPQEETDRIIASQEAILKKKGEVLEVNRWGRRSLAYDIRKSREGNFTEIVYRAEPSVNDEIRQSCRVNEQVLRCRILYRQPETPPMKKSARQDYGPDGDDDRDNYRDNW